MTDKTEQLPPHIIQRNMWRPSLEAFARIMQDALARDPGAGPELRALIETLPDTFPVPMSCLSPEDVDDAVADTRAAMDKGRGQGVPTLAKDTDVPAPHDVASDDWSWRRGRSRSPADFGAFQKNVISAGLMQRIRGVGPICGDCAQKHGGSWPEDRVARVSVQKCGICEEEKDCADRSAWNFPWIKPRPMEREF